MRNSNTAASGMIYALEGGYVRLRGLIQFTGTARAALYAATGGHIIASYNATTLQFNDFTATTAIAFGNVGYQIYLGGTIFTGAAIGRKYYAGSGGLITADGEPEAIPGMIAGVALTDLGGYYQSSPPADA